jgi:diguanylate cyclase (GGDEF)-like protein
MGALLNSAPAAVSDRLSSQGRGVGRRLRAVPAIPPEIIGRLQALEAGDLSLRFQPILLLRDPGRIALELLVRFLPPELAAAGTGVVVQWAHDLDPVHCLDQLVIQRLAEVHQALRELGPLAQRIDYISVNISSGSVATPERQEALIAMLRDQRVDPDLFRLELAETTAMDVAPGVDEMRTVSQRLMEELGIRLLVDDFGSGLSNYRRLCEAWYDAIKLDLELVRGISTSLRLQTFVGSLIEAVHGLGNTVVAEGVEQHRDLETLLRLGVDAVQGYLIAPALRWSELVPFLEGSPWLDLGFLPAQRARIARADAQLTAPLRPSPLTDAAQGRVPLERYVLEHWANLRSFEEVFLLYVQELRGWGLDVMRMSLAFLPNRQEVDCTQYIWYAHNPGEMESKRMQRDFLLAPQHLQSVLHHIATAEPVYRLPLVKGAPTGFAFLDKLCQWGGSDYLGLRLSSRGVSTPVLSVCLQGAQRFAPEQIERIETLSGLLSLLFHAFESERASRLALLDSLTQLPNRRSFDSRVSAEVVAAKTRQLPLALLLIDVDRFKLVNDRLGHATGDSCLSELAAVLRQQMQRRDDMVARLGGEEFGVVLAHTDPQTAAAIAERLRKAVADARIQHPAPVNGIGLTISLGLASWVPQSGASLDLDRLLRQADDCLYAAKGLGRNRVVAAVLSAGQSEGGRGELD